MNPEFKPDNNTPSASSNKWGAMLAVGLSVFMGTLDVNIVSVSLPTLVRTLNTTFTHIQWVMLSYILVLTTLTLSFARVGDMIGKKKVFMVGLSVFTVSSLLCGLAPGASWLIGFRALQGLGSAMTQALGVAIVTEAFPASERGKAMGIIGSTVSVGLAMGPAVGGLMIGWFGWRSIFLINVPIGVFAVWATLRYAPSSPKRPGQRFDYAGAAILLIVLVCYAMGMTMGQAKGFSSGAIYLLAAAVIGVIIFILVERTVNQPMLDLSLFKSGMFSLNLIMSWLIFVVIGATFIIPFFLELVKNYPPQTVGLVMMVTPLSMGLIAPISGSLSDRYGARGVSVAGLLLAIVGCISISGMNSETSLLGVILRSAPFGLGMGFFQSPNNSAIMGSVPRERLGLASGLMSLSRTIGHTTGIPLAGTIFTAIVTASAHAPEAVEVTLAPPAALVEGLAGTYHVGAVVVGIALLLAVYLLFSKKGNTGTGKPMGKPAG